MFGCDKAPKYPTAQMDRQIASSEALGNRFMDLSAEQQQWARDNWDDNMFPLLQEVLGNQSQVMTDNLENARKDRARYESVYQPLEDNLIEEFQNYDTEARRNQESGRAQGQVQSNFDAQRANAEQRLASYGVDPSQIRGGAIDRQARTQLALGKAASGNQARQRTEDIGRSLRAEAINIGRGMPSQVAGSYGTALAGGNSAIGNSNSTMGQGANMQGTGQGWGQMSGNQNSSTMAGINNMYSGQMAGYDQSGGLMGSLGNIGGQVLGGWAASGFAEGGGAVGMTNSDLSAVPGPNDNIPVTLAQDEYIIPKDVVMRLGTEKLDKLLESTRQKAGEKGGANANTPVGAMPNPEPPIKGQTMAAEGGGAVGQMIMPTPVEINQMAIPINTGWGVGDGAGDPFADYRQSQAIKEQGQAQSNAAIQDTSAAMFTNAKDNWDSGEGAPGALNAWLEKRKYGGLEPATVTAERRPAAEGGGAVGSMPGKPKQYKNSKSVY